MKIRRHNREQVPFKNVKQGEDFTLAGHADALLLKAERYAVLLATGGIIDDIENDAQCIIVEGEFVEKGA